MFFEEEYGFFHWLDLFKGPIFDLFDITKMSHNFHKKFLVFIGSSAFWGNSDSSLNTCNERIDVLDLFVSVVKEEASISVNPEGDGVLELFDEWSYVNSKPSDINGSLHECNFILCLSQESDLLIECFEVWSLGLNSNENLLRHPFEGLVFLFFSLIIDFDVSLLSWIKTSVKESLEAVFKGFFP